MTRDDGAEYVPVVDSPCISLCVMDDATGWCLGCARTIDEIAHWGNAAAADRALVMTALPARLAQLAEVLEPRADR